MVRAHPAWLTFAIVAVAAALCFGAPAAGAEANAPPAFKMSSIGLYLPEPFLGQRTRGDVGPLSAYIKALEAKSNEVLAGEPAMQGLSGALVVMIKPGSRARFWFAGGAERLPDGARSKLNTALLGVPVPAVHDGPLVFALNFDAWGNQPGEPGPPISFPKEWIGVAPEGGRIDDDFLKKVWPDE
jgi:hypothetical protein